MGPWEEGRECVGHAWLGVVWAMCMRPPCLYVSLLTWVFRCILYHARIYHKQMKKMKPSRFHFEVLSWLCIVPAAKKQNALYTTSSSTCAYNEQTHCVCVCGYIFVSECRLLAPISVTTQ